MYLRGRRDERVHHRDGRCVLLTAPGGGNAEGHWQDPILEPGLYLPEPALEGEGLVPVPPAENSGDPLLDLAQGEHGDVQLARRRGRDPIRDAYRWLAPARLR